MRIPLLETKSLRTKGETHQGCGFSLTSRYTYQRRCWKIASNAFDMKVQDIWRQGNKWVDQMAPKREKNCFLWWSSSVAGSRFIRNWVPCIFKSGRKFDPVLENLAHIWFKKGRTRREDYAHSLWGLLSLTLSCLVQERETDGKEAREREDSWSFCIYSIWPTLIY